MPVLFIADVTTFCTHSTCGQLRLEQRKRLPTQFLEKKKSDVSLHVAINSNDNITYSFYER